MKLKFAWVEPNSFSIDWVFAAWPNPILVFSIQDKSGGSVSPRIELTPTVRFDVLMEQLKSKYIMLVWVDGGTSTPKIVRVLAMNTL